MKYFFLAVSAFDAAASYVEFNRGNFGWALMLGACSGWLLLVALTHAATSEDDSAFR